MMKGKTIICILCLLALAAGMYGIIQCRVVHVEYADVYLRDLPEQLDGVKLLYVSDIHISSESDIRRTQHLMQQLQTAQPDILLLGGDYSDVRMWNTLRCAGDKERKAEYKRRAVELSHQWMETLAEFSAPLGKFAVDGNHDSIDATLAEALAAGGVKLLENESVTIQRDGAKLVIAGVEDLLLGDYQPYSAAKNVKAGDCCILLSHNPDALPQLFTMDAQDGGSWVDLALSGHTHGGQVRIGNWVPINPSDYGLTYLTGWCEQASGYSLTSNGVGCTSLPVRIGAPAQAHIITLHSQD